jgi:hypothetical protein
MATDTEPEQAMETKAGSGLGNAIIQLIAVPSVVLALTVITRVELKPLARWGLSRDALIFFPALVGAAVALKHRRKGQTNPETIKWVLISFFCSIVSMFMYNEISDTPPTPANTWYYGRFCFALFVFTYFSLGYCLTQVGRILTNKKA